MIAELFSRLAQLVEVAFFYLNYSFALWQKQKGFLISNQINYF